MDVEQFYSGLNVFITGGTGFVGLCLIEKLLRCVPDIGTVYILIRQKHNKSINVRLDELSRDPLFNTLKDLKGVAVFQKIHVVAGDISQTDLELRDEDEDLLIKNVNIVFHCAASLDFSENLRNSVNVNLLGTRRVIELCKRMMNLKALVHVSSAYVNAHRKFAKEVIYPLPNDAERIIRLLENLDDKVIDHIMPAILDSSPNAYTFTKSLAEHEVVSANSCFPTVVIRPSMITGTWKEPVPGWTNSKNGPQGFIMGAAKGVVRRLPIDRYIIYDYIPVDIVVNEIISSAWYVVEKNRGSETLILHCTTSTCKPFKWSDIENQIPRMLNSYPLLNAVWYPTLKLVPSKGLFRLSAFLFHMIPAYTLDFVMRLCGRKPILVRLHNNINKSLDTLYPFIFNEWKFDNTNTTLLQQSLSNLDRQKFNVEVTDLVWKSYFRNLVLGVRQYLNKESLNNLAAAKRKNTYLWCLNIAVQIFVIHVIFFLVCFCSGTAWFMNLWCVPGIIFFLNYL